MGLVGVGIIYLLIFNMSQLHIGGGLDNLGNTCFFNATLQSLLHTRPLATILVQRLHSHSCRLKQLHQWCCFCELETVFAATRHNKRYSPNGMINHLKSIFKKFKLGRQQDSHEFLRYLVEGMQDSQTGKSLNPNPKQPINTPSKQSREALQSRIRSSRVFGVFGGLMKTCVDCLNCNNKSITCERYYDFNIVPPEDKGFRNANGINHFFAVDKLEGNNKYLCEHCKVRSNARKRFLLESVPQVATFQLKRFTNSLRKIGKFIQFPLSIDLGRYLDVPRKVLLKLYAIVVHAGGSSYSGHYYAFVRVGENWFKMDDGYVSKCSQESVFSQNAYLLFYEKVFQQESKTLPEVNKKVVDEVKKQADDKKDVNTANHVNKSTNHVGKVSSLQQQHKEEPATMNGVKLNGIVHHDDDDDDEDDEDYQFEEEDDEDEDDQELDEEEEDNHKGSLLNGVVKKMAESTHNQPSNQKQHKPQIISSSNDWNITPQEGISKKHQKDPEVPNKLKRRRSKQEMENSLSTQEIVLRVFEKVIEIASKMPKHRPHNQSWRHIYKLRKYETVMQKKRKIG